MTLFQSQSIAAIVSPRIGCGAPVVFRKQP